MKDCPELHGKSWYNKAKETGLQNAGEARLASYSGNFETLIFLYFRNQGGAGLRKRTKGSERGHGKKEEPGAGPELEKVHRKRRENDA